MNVQTVPKYRESNPKIDLYILGSKGGLKYYGSTNYWATVRDCINWYNRSQGHSGLLFPYGADIFWETWLS
jgi:hypothetical protein